MIKILITGADGFIGSHLTELLVHKGYSVKALSQYNSFNNWGWLEKIDCKDKVEVISGILETRITVSILQKILISFFTLLH